MRHNTQKIMIVPNQTAMIMLILGVLTFILIMLLPSFLELKAPKDAGPRVILDNTANKQSLMIEIIQIEDIEEEQKQDQTLAKKIADIIAILPNIEI